MENVTIRASSMSSLFDCPARWEATHINKIWMPRSPRSLIGNAVHHGADTFDTSSVNNQGLTINETAGSVVDYINDVSQEVDWIGLTRKEVESKAIELHQIYCSRIAPQFDYAAVEFDCNPVSMIIEDLILTITGQPDRIYQTLAGNYGGLDIKTGFAVIDAEGIVETVAHRPQMGSYEILIESQYQAIGLEMSEPFVIAGLSTAGKKANYGLGMIHGAKEYLLGKPDEGQLGLLNYAARLLKSGLFFGNPNSMACTKQYCPIYSTCKFRGN